jgi:hypothetical protein
MDLNMMPLRLIALILTALLSLSACGKSDEPDQATATAGENELLSYVPADTPYLMANLEPISEDILDSYLAKFQPVLEAMQAELSQTRTGMESADNTTGDPAAQLAHALLSELDGKLNRAGMEGMGFDLRAHKVIYGVGAFPVVRLGLSDSAALRATILRVMEKAGVTAPEQTYQDVSYWRVSDDDPTDVPAGIYISILEDHLAIGLLPLVAEAELLPAFLGLEKPAETNAGARLAKLNRTHGYTAYGSGILDTHRLIDELVQPASLVGRAMASSENLDHAVLTPDCITEIHGIADNAPYMTLGVQELTTTAIAMQYRVETPESLAGQLMGLVSEIPVANALSERILEFAFGLKFGPVRDFLLEKTTAIVNAPYECEHLNELNANASETLAKLSEPMPPFLNNFRGIRASISEFITGNDSTPQSARGLLALHLEQPQMLVGMAQMMLPDLSGLEITAGDPPVRLPENLVPTPGVAAFAAMSSDAIGVALGEGEDAALPAFLDQEAGPKGIFLSASYDMSAYLEYSEMVSGHIRATYDEPAEEKDDHHHDSSEVQKAAAKVFREIADRNTTTVSFTPDGLVIENRVTLK